jgi:hypothetical protein
MPGARDLMFREAGFIVTGQAASGSKIVLHFEHAYTILSTATVWSLRRIVRVRPGLQKPLGSSCFPHFFRPKAQWLSPGLLERSLQELGCKTVPAKIRR